MHPTDALIAGHTHWREPGTGRILPLPTARNAQGRTQTGQTHAANDAEGAKGGVRIRYYHCDQIGTPRELTRPTGEITWQATYKAWGNTQTVQWEVAVSTAQDQTIIDVEHDKVDRSGQQPLRFQGQYFDEETGLHYNRFRYYDPDSGRFISHDPIGLAGGTNLFQYAPNPVGWIDPFGLTGAAGVWSGPNVPGGTISGLSKLEGGSGIKNPAVQQAYDNAKAELGDKVSAYHGDCAEPDMLSKGANTAGVKTLEDLKRLSKDSTMNVVRNDKKMKPMKACPSCEHVQKQLGIQDGCNSQK